MSVGQVLEKQDLDHIFLFNQARWLRRINSEMRPVLPESLRKNAGIANICKGTLTLYAHTPAWCYKLRLHSRAIVKFLNNQNISIQKVRYVVVPVDSFIDTLTTRNLPKRELQPRALNLIEENANKVKDEELRQVLLNFVKNSAKISNR